MTDTANTPERIWMTAEDHGASWHGAFRAFRCSNLDHSNDDGPNPDYPEYVLATHCDELVAAARAEGAREAQAKLDELRSDRPFIVGWNEGFAEAEYQQAHGKPSDGDLSPQYQHTAKEVAEAHAKIARLTEALKDAVEIVHKSYVLATMEAVNAGPASPIAASHDAWRAKCVRAEEAARAALQENANG